MTRDEVVARNAAVLMVGQIVSWSLGLVFIVIVPRSVGAGQWGEWSLAWAMTAMAGAVVSLGLSPLLIKEMSRQPSRTGELVGAALTAQALLAVPYILLVAGLTIVAGYPLHTRIVIALVTAGALVLFFITPVSSALQALEKMHFNSISNILQNGLLAITAIVLVKFAAVGIIAISFASLATLCTAALFQWFALRRSVHVRPRLDWPMILRLVKAGLPFWAGGLFLSFYMWIDSVLLSILTSTKEVGWYGVAVQLISTTGFLPYIITMAVFPALSHGFKHDPAVMSQLARRSLRLLATLALPMMIGIAIVGPTLIRFLYGPNFDPAGPVLVVLSFTLLPMFIATLVNGFLVAVDRQVHWTIVMAALCVINPLINLVSISFFDHHYGNGAYGAAIALLVTDVLVGVAALVLLPRDLLGNMRSVLPAVGRAAIAAGMMGIVVWPFRDTFIAIPIGIGSVAFAMGALALRVFAVEDVELARGLVGKLAAKVRVRPSGRATASDSAGTT